VRHSTSPGGRNVTVVYVDTEGFEGTGQASVYDDRIFAFATLVSSVIVYNLVIYIYIYIYIYVYIYIYI